LSFAAGEVYWAIVPYTPATPLKVHVANGAPVEVPTASQIVDGLRKGGDAEFEFVVRAKARPVLLLSGHSDPRTGDLLPCACSGSRSSPTESGSESKSNASRRSSICSPSISPISERLQQRW